MLAGKTCVKKSNPFGLQLSGKSEKKQIKITGLQRLGPSWMRSVEIRFQETLVLMEECS